MLKPRSNSLVAANFTWTLAGNAIYATCQWGIVLILAKLGSPKDVGEYALGMAICAPVMVLASLQLRSLLASDGKDQYTFGHYLGLRLVSMLVALVVVLGIILFTQRSLKLGSIILLVGFSQALEWISDTYYGLMQKTDRMDRISKSLMMKGPLSLAAMALAMYRTGDLQWALVGLILGRLCLLFLWDARLQFLSGTQLRAITAHPHWNARATAALLRTALPLGVISALVSLNANVPRYFIEAHWGNHDLGIFAAILSLATSGNMIISSIGQSVFVQVFKAHAERDRSQYRSLVCISVGLAALCGLVGVGAAAFKGREILTMFFRAAYGEHSDVFVRLAVMSLFSYVASVLGHIMTAIRILAPQIPLQILVGFVLLATSAVLIPKHGILGAAEAAICGAMAHMVGEIWVLIRAGRRSRTADPTCAGSIGTSIIAES